MSELEPLIADLALILICAGAMTLLFKRLKQPVVLGYIVAGFLASPNMSYMPSVTDLHGIHIWSEIGVIFLLFSLGLEFSFRKILRMGAAPIIAACAVIAGMMLVGMSTGQLFGWSQMDCIYLGGMLAMSSTTIIFKAFDDMGLRQKRFAGLVLSVLIIEDILAIVLMVMLSTLAVSKEFEGSQMLMSILKLAFFLVLWFVVGIYLIPLFLRKVKPLMSNETLLITALALCFGMVVIASAVGFSAAFGAFIMGSILAETVEREQIEHLVSPVKDLFGAIFFVSVGMMVDVALIAEYIVPILCIVASIMLGQTILSTCGFLLAGQSLKTAMQCSFSLTQIGEFAFILATLGTSLHVTSDFLYPIVVAVSVFTTFTTPYMIRLAEPAYAVVERVMPQRWRSKLQDYAEASNDEEPESGEQQSPDIRMANHAMEEAFYNTQAARAAFFPSITLTGTAGWTNSAGSAVINPGKLLLSFVGQLTQPIFARGKLKANLKINQLTQENLQKKYVQTVIDAGNQVNEAMADCQAAREKFAYYRRQVQVLYDAYTGTHELMDNGKASYIEVLTAQENLLSAQLNEASNMYKGAQAVIALYIALGGGTK
jgi:CPA2 family monovalent cation:H+ antiporter-2